MYCFYLEDDGLGHQGYVWMDDQTNIIFPNIQSARDRFEQIHQNGNAPKLKARDFGYDIPKAWKIRELDRVER